MQRYFVAMPIALVVILYSPLHSTSASVQISAAATVLRVDDEDGLTLQQGATGADWQHGFGGHELPTEFNVRDHVNNVTTLSGEIGTPNDMSDDS